MKNTQYFHCDDCYSTWSIDTKSLQLSESFEPTRHCLYCEMELCWECANDHNCWGGN